MRTVFLALSFIVFIFTVTVADAAEKTLPIEGAEDSYEICKPDQETGLRPVVFEPEFGSATWPPYGETTTKLVFTAQSIREEIVENTQASSEYNYLMSQRLAYLTPDGIFANEMGQPLTSELELEILEGKPTPPQIEYAYKEVMLPEIKKTVQNMQDSLSAKYLLDQKNVIRDIKSGPNCRFYMMRSNLIKATLVKISHGVNNGLTCSPLGGTQQSNRLDYLAVMSRPVVAMPDGAAIHLKDRTGNYDVYGIIQDGLGQILDNSTSGCEWTEVEIALPTLEKIANDSWEK